MMKIKRSKIKTGEWNEILYIQTVGCTCCFNLHLHELSDFASFMSDESSLQVSAPRKDYAFCPLLVVIGDVVIVCCIHRKSILQNIRKTFCFRNYFPFFHISLCVVLLSSYRLHSQPIRFRSLVSLCSFQNFYFTKYNTDWL